MTELKVPDLTFPAIQYGKHEVPWDLRPLLYRNGAGVHTKKVAHKIAKGKLGAPIAGRLPLVEKFHAEIAGSDSRWSAYNGLTHLRAFYAWADKAGRLLTLDSVEQDFIDWTDHLLFRVRVRKDLSRSSAGLKNTAGRNRHRRARLCPPNGAAAALCEKRSKH